MPGLFDGIRTGLKGTLVNRKMVEVVGNNIANAANENYSRQEGRLTTSGAIFDGKLSFGQGVEIQKVLRIRDELLDKQLRATSSASSSYHTQLKWFKKIESLYNEPSEHGINQALSEFWEAWSELSTDPENFATRSNVIAQTDNLTSLIRNLDHKFVEFNQELTLEIEQIVKDINSLADDVAQLNKEIFRLETSGDNQANDLRDQRDFAMEKLAEKISFTAKNESNGMINLLVGQHPLVYQNRAENLITRIDPLDASKTQVLWENGDNDFEPSGGDIAAVMEMRDTLASQLREDMNQFVGTFIEEVNRIYSNGVSMDPKYRMESRLGFQSLGVSSSTSKLSMVPSGQYGSMHVSFYDSSGNLVRVAGIVVDEEDSLDDVVQKMNGIRGLNVETISSANNDGRVSMEIDAISGENNLGEVSFAVSNNEGGYDSSGFLSLVGFDQLEKSSNDSSTVPSLSGVDLTTLQTQLGEPDLSSVMSKQLNLSGTFTINAFETGSESTGKTNGIHVQQFIISVESSDSINSIMSKINNLTADHGAGISLNASNQLVLSSSAATDSEGNVSLSGGTNYLRLSFANTYQYPTVSEDEPPPLYNGKGDDTGILSKMQFNTWFQGDSASDIALDDFIDSADKVNTGYIFADGDNSMTLDLSSLQHANVAFGGNFTISEYYQNLVSQVGTNVRSVENQANNEDLVLQSFLRAKDQISGVNIDEELANMIIFQRAYEANARMIKTFSDMIDEFLD